MAGGELVTAPGAALVRAGVPGDPRRRALRHPRPFLGGSEALAGETLLAADRVERAPLSRDGHAVPRGRRPCACRCEVECDLRAGEARELRVEPDGPRAPLGRQPAVERRRALENVDSLEHAVQRARAEEDGQRLRLAVDVQPPEERSDAPSGRGERGSNDGRARPRARERPLEAEPPCIELP